MEIFLVILGHHAMIDWFVSAWNDFWHVVWLLRLVYVVAAVPLVPLALIVGYTALLARGGKWEQGG